MADTIYLDALIRAIKYVYKESKRSGDYFASTSGRERSMVFRIAHRLASRIEGNGVFVDLEPTKCDGECKMCKSDKDNKKHHAYPDLIIHQRKNTGYLVVEFKCSDDDKEREHDEDKLINLTRREHKPHYKFGAFVYLANNMQDIQIKIFKDGCENTKLTDISKKFNGKLK